MRIVALQKRQDHDTLLSRTAASGGALLLAALTALPWQAAPAQGPCTAITDDAERLACYDRALRGAPPAAATPSAAAPPAAAPRPKRRARSGSPPARSGGNRARRGRRRSPRNPNVPCASRPLPPHRQRRSRGATSAEPQIVPLVIVDWRALPGREAKFTAEDGTIWVQTDSQRLTGMPDAAVRRRDQARRHGQLLPRARRKGPRHPRASARSKRRAAIGSGAARAGRPRRGRGSSCRDRSSPAR